jgi:type IV secretion system protein VirB2
VGTLLGSVATGVSVLAVAFLGFGKMFGHLDWRTGERVALGIFILFGAPVIARELAALARGDEAAAPSQMAAGVLPKQLTMPKNTPAADPYAGAEMPQR